VTDEGHGPAARRRGRDRLRGTALIGAWLSVPVGFLVMLDGLSVGLSDFPTGFGSSSGEEDRVANWLLFVGLVILVTAVVTIVALAKRSPEVTAVVAGVQAVATLAALYLSREANRLAENDRGNDTAWYAVEATALVSAILALAWGVRAWSAGPSDPAPHPERPQRL
jgi:hypothetical protein